MSRSKMLVDVHHYHHLAQCAADIEAARLAVLPQHAARCIKQAMAAAEKALDIPTFKRAV